MKKWIPFVPLVFLLFVYLFTVRGQRTILDHYGPRMTVQTARQVDVFLEREGFPFEYIIYVKITEPDGETYITDMFSSRDGEQAARNNFALYIQNVKGGSYEYDVFHAHLAEEYH